MAELHTTITEHPAMSRLRIVLVRPQVAGNIGAVARLMENFEAGALYLVDPQADAFSPEALRRSAHGARRLQEARVVRELNEALEGAGLCIGATRRVGPTHQAEDLNPREMAEVVRQRIGEGDVALLFGSEDNGLAREDLLACDTIVRIPAGTHYPTLNLSHAVAICLYEVFVTLTGGPLPEKSINRPAEAADAAMMNRLTEKLQHALSTIGYLRPEKPDHLMFPIRHILSRANLSRAEAQILIGLAQQIDEFARYEK
ncbi:MAG: hypothetical protein GXY44_09700 [Phycisphaerales bacterium]|nr:hypothetical protein [Phycisphaerales bacterium]